MTHGSDMPSRICLVASTVDRRRLLAWKRPADRAAATGHDARPERVSSAFTLKPTARMLICGSVRPIRPSTSVASSRAVIAGAAARMPEHEALRPAAS